MRGASRPYVSPSPYSLSVESRLVDVGVVVRDARGRVMPGLKQSDFRLLDDGKERPITVFSVDSTRVRSNAAAATASPSPAPAASAPVNSNRPPRFVVLFFDDANTYTGDLTHAQIAARRFVKDGLSPGDRIAVMTSSSAHTLEFTADAAKIVDIINHIKSHPRVPEAGLGACPRITPYQAYLISARLDQMALKAAVDEVYACADQEAPQGINLPRAQTNSIVLAVKGQSDQTWDQVRIVSESTLDAVDFAVEHLSKQPGTRLLVLVSAGFLAGTMERHQDLVVDHALHAGVVINAVDAKGVYSEAPVRPFGEPKTSTQAAIQTSTYIFQTTEVLGRVAEQAVPLGTFAAGTGGLFFHNNNDLNLAFQEIGVEPEITYHLGFAPPEMEADGKYHKLKVMLTSGAKDPVQARPGYFAPERAAEKKMTGADENRLKLDRALMGNEILSGLQASVSVKPGEPVTSVANIDLTGLKFVEKDGRKIQRLTFIVGLLDAQGKLAAAKEGEMELALTPATFRKMALTGLNAAVSLQAPPGSYRLREVIQDGVEGRITTTTQTVQIPQK